MTRPPGTDAATARKVQMTIYLTPAQHAELRALTERTGVPWSRLVREGIDLVLARADLRERGASIGGGAGEEHSG